MDINNPTTSNFPYIEILFLEVGKSPFVDDVTCQKISLSLGTSLELIRRWIVFAVGWVK